MSLIPTPLSFLGEVDKTKLLNTLGIWIMVFCLTFFLFFREDPNKLNQETVDKLVVAVDKFAKATDSITQAAIKQREWAANLEQQLILNNRLLERGYKGIYEKYGYDNTAIDSPLDDLYARQLLIATESNSSGKLRGDEVGVSKASALQGSAGSTKTKPN